ncbi:calcium-binding and coiled-coil domain-containing protein 1-like [Corticium candelabrum]|uniref:calcium-binding and coiled-coil domain-containing protein 1-like n=1 Tax=Corticium candelabrum TaxID=121492 RepID=UPI002E272A7A|nr:calcium-binding and coiled-coil domain-containing protein 1-like [Corticium candelabrum]
MTVEFVDVPRLFPSSTTIACHFVHSISSQPTDGAWIALLKVGWRTVATYFCFEWASVAAYGKDNVKVILFQEKSLPNDTSKDQYQFVYVDGKGQVLGSSDPFTFSHDGDSMSSFEYVSTSLESTPLKFDTRQDGDDEGGGLQSVGNVHAPVKGAENCEDVSQAEKESGVKPGADEMDATILNGEVEDLQAQEFGRKEIEQQTVIVSRESHTQVVEVNDATTGMEEVDEEEGSRDCVHKVEGAGSSGLSETENEVVKLQAISQEEMWIEGAQTESRQSGLSRQLVDVQPLQEPGCLATCSYQVGSNQENGNSESMDRDEDVKPSAPLEVPTDELPVSMESSRSQSDDDDVLDAVAMMKEVIELREEISLLKDRNLALENVVKEYIAIAAPLDKSNAALQSMWKIENQAYNRVSEKLKGSYKKLAEDKATIAMLEDKINTELKSKEAIKVELTRCQEAHHEVTLQLHVIQRNLMRVEKEKDDSCLELKETQKEKQELEVQLREKENEYNKMLHHVGKLEVRCETLNEQIHVRDRQTEILFGTTSDYLQQNSGSIPLSSTSDVCIACPPSVQEEMSQVDNPSYVISKSEQHAGASKTSSSSRKHSKKHTSRKDRKRDRHRKDPAQIEVVPVTLTEDISNPSRCFACGLIFPIDATADDRRRHFEDHYEDQETASSEAI